MAGAHCYSSSSSFVPIYWAILHIAFLLTESLNLIDTVTAHLQSGKLRFRNSMTSPKLQRTRTTILVTTRPKLHITLFQKKDVCVVCLCAHVHTHVSASPSGCFSRVIRERMVLAQSQVCCSLGAPEYSPQFASSLTPPRSQMVSLPGEHRSQWWFGAEDSLVPGRVNSPLSQSTEIKSVELAL